LHEVLTGETYNICRALIVSGGIGSFILAKNSINKSRYDAMKSRERMKKANIGDYPTTRNFVKDSTTNEDISN